MIEENKFGFRDKRGHFVPNEAADKNPLWILPVNIKKIFNWFVFSYIFSWNLFYLFIAFVTSYRIFAFLNFTVLFFYLIWVIFI